MRFPDSEALVVQFLQMKLGAIPVSTKVPKVRPSVFVRVSRSGGAASSRVLDQPILTVEAWGDSAHELIRECREALFNEYTLMPLVRGVEEVSGPYFSPDPASNVDRYICNVQLQVRAHR